MYRISEALRRVHCTVDIQRKLKLASRLLCDGNVELESIIEDN